MIQVQCLGYVPAWSTWMKPMLTSYCTCHSISRTSFSALPIISTEGAIFYSSGDSISIVKIEPLFPGTVHGLKTPWWSRKTLVSLWFAKTFAGHLWHRHQDCRCTKRGWTCTPGNFHSQRESFDPLVQKTLDVWITEGEMSSVGCQKEFRVEKDRVRRLLSKWKIVRSLKGRKSSSARSLKIWVRVFVKYPKLIFWRLWEPKGIFEGLWNERKARETCSGWQTAWGSSEGSWKKEYILGTPRVLYNTFVLGLLWGVVLGWKKLSVNVWTSGCTRG